MDTGLAKTGRAESIKDRSVRTPYGEALELARRIEGLVSSELGGSGSSNVYAARLAQAMTRSLIDQLSELARNYAA